MLDVEPELVSVLIEEFDRANWASGGELYSDKFGTQASLTCKGNGGRRNEDGRALEKGGGASRLVVRGL